MYGLKLVKRNIMLDFKSTYDQGDFIHFCNENGDTVKIYLMSQLEYYVIINNLNVITVSANGCSSIDPNIIEQDEATPVSDYIDENWFSLTEEFYNHVNTKRKN